MKNLIQPGDAITVTAPTGGISSGDRIVIGNLFGICATDAGPDGRGRTSLTGVLGVLGQWPDRDGAKVWWSTTDAKVQERYGGRALPDGTAVKATGTSDTTLRVRFDGVAVVAAGP
jgi:predicted RecA/RadA family phage recombinase